MEGRNLHFLEGNFTGGRIPINFLRGGGVGPTSPSIFYEYIQRRNVRLIIENISSRRKMSENRNNSDLVKPWTHPVMENFGWARKECELEF